MTLEKLFQEDMAFRSYKYLKQFNFTKIQTSFKEISNTINFDRETNQIGLTHRRNCSDKLYDAVGRAIHPEEEFTEFNEQFKNTYFYDIYEFLHHRFKFKIGRVRLIKVPKQRCFSWHRDNEVRIHIPINTCYGAFFLFDDNTYIHFPADGGAWLVDTTRFHTSINTSQEDRIHLLINVYGKEEC